jgi:hypothetical protein
MSVKQTIKYQHKELKTKVNEVEEQRTTIEVYIVGMI